MGSHGPAPRPPRHAAAIGWITALDIVFGGAAAAVGLGLAVAPHPAAHAIHSGAVRVPPEAVAERTQTPAPLVLPSIGADGAWDPATVTPHDDGKAPGDAAFAAPAGLPYVPPASTTRSPLSSTAAATSAAPSTTPRTSSTPRTTAPASSSSTPPTSTGAPTVTPTPTTSAPATTSAAPTTSAATTEAVPTGTALAVTSSTPDTSSAEPSP